VGGDARLGEARDLRQFSYRQLLGFEQRQQPQAGRVAQQAAMPSGAVQVDDYILLSRLKDIA
jgi:hypothetical protein